MAIKYTVISPDGETIHSTHRTRETAEAEARRAYRAMLRHFGHDPNHYSGYPTNYRGFSVREVETAVRKAS